jgi:hypothetical protein
MTPNPHPHAGSTRYQIRVKGHLPDYWSDWFDGLTLTLDTERGETIMAGSVIDQAALHGLLNRVRDLGLVLLAVNQIESDEDNSLTSP